MTDLHRQELPPHAISRIAAFLEPGKRLGTVTQLQLRPLVADYCKKFIALDSEGRPAAFVSLSPASYANYVLDAVNSARRVADALGPLLSETVLLPHFVGEIEGRSYSITAYRRPLSSSRLRGAWQRSRLRPAAFEWLAQITRESATAITALDEEVSAPLHALATHSAVDISTQHAARSALDALDSGAWQPRSTIVHNDLWWGNFVYRDDGPDSRFHFQVIDWGGAELRGAPMYDLVRLTESFGTGARQLGAQIRDHCEILECAPQQSLHYLSLALARLSLNLGEWPVSQFASTASACLRYASDALR